MMPINEALHPDSSDYNYSVNENVVKKTNTELSKVFDDEVKMSSASSIIKKIQELNPGVTMETDFDRGIIYSSVNVTFDSGFGSKEIAESLTPYFFVISGNITLTMLVLIV